MDKPGTGDMQLVRRMNRLAILGLIREHGPVTRVALTHLSGLSPATTFSIVAELVQDGLVLDQGSGSSAGGRRPHLFRFNPGAFGALGVDLRANRLIGVVTDLDAQVIARLDHPYPGPVEPQAAAALIRAKVQELLQLSGFPPDRLVGVGISLPALIDPDGGKVIRSINWGWEQVDLRQLVGDLAGLPLYVLDVSIALALGEAYFGAGRGARNAVCVNVGEGIGSGIFLEGQLYLGSDGVAGEIGHMTVDEDGPQCRCGNYGCLERLAAGPAIIERTLKGLKYGAVSSLRDRLGSELEQVSLQMIVDAAREGDEFTRNILVETGRYLGVGVANVVNLLNPEVVVIGGEVSHMAADILLEPLRQAILFRALEVHARRVQVLRSHLGMEASAIGASAWAMIQAGILTYPRAGMIQTSSEA